MSETELHAPFLGYRGTIGKLVYKKYKGRTIVSHKPGRRTKKNEEGAPQTKVFGTGITYAKKAMAKPAVRAFYQERAKALETPIFALAVGDYLNAPTIEELDFDEYMGQVGDIILITTHDDVGVVRLEVSLTAADGTPIEKGLAVEPTHSPGRGSIPPRLLSPLAQTSSSKPKGLTGPAIGPPARPTRP